MLFPPHPFSFLSAVIPPFLLDSTALSYISNLKNSKIYLDRIDKTESSTIKRLSEYEAK